MKKIQLLAIGTGLFTLSALNNANAVDSGIIDFTGTIVASLCTPDFNGTDTQTVPLGMYPIDTFTGAGDKSDLKDIALSFTGCPASTATITFQGIGQAGDTNLLQLTPGSTPESHIAIALFEENGTPLPINTASSTTHTLTPGPNDITYKAAYQQHAAGTVPVGPAPGTATLDIEYN
ncbi:MAG: hypothetical protein RLY17_492 [Pseudomonadota bacterium]|jgi:type 1 fimbria pilin